MKINTFTAFKSRNYRLYFFGQSISLMGTWMQRTAIYWVVYAQTHSAFILGLTSFAMFFPSFLFSLFGGAVADKYNRYHVLLVTQSTSMLQALVLTLVVFFTKYSVTEILLLSVLLGIINAFDVPARQSLVHFMVDDQAYLNNAIALNSSMVNLARLIGPAVAGVMLDAFGAGVCFLTNTLSFIAVLASLLLMHLPASLPQMKSQKILEGLREGLAYLKATPSVSILIILLSLVSFFILPVVTLFPAVAKTVLNGGAATYGYLNSFVGIGALCATMFIASLHVKTNYKKILVIGLGTVSVGLLAFSRMHHPLFAFVFAAIAGFGMMLQTTITNTLLQTTTSIEIRGRIISYFAMALFGMQPLGSLMIGTLAHYIGTQNTIFFEGIVAVLLLFFFAPKLLKSPHQAA
jgi:MFS family permease